MKEDLTDKAWTCGCGALNSYLNKYCAKCKK
jgi:hypothetical protein